MSSDHETASSPVRRSLLKWTALTAGVASFGVGSARAEQREVGGLRKGMFSFMLAHEQFSVPDLLQLGALASRSGFQVLSTSDHFQPWHADEGHAGQAWVTMAAYDVSSPVTIQQQAEQQTPIEEVTKSWAVGTEPAVHINAVRDLFDSGVSIVNIHSGQPEQRKVIEFYATHVLPKFRQPA